MDFIHSTKNDYKSDRKIVFSNIALLQKKVHDFVITYYYNL